jgi:hypothetical protein
VIVVGYLLGSLVTGLVAAVALAHCTHRLHEAAQSCADAQEEGAVLALHLLRAWAEVDQLRVELGLLPVIRPTLADLSRTARCQEDQCSSSRRSSAT